MPQVDVLIPTTGNRCSLATAALAGLSQSYPGTRTVVIQDGAKEASSVADEICEWLAARYGDELLYELQATSLACGALVRQEWLRDERCAPFVRFLDDDDWMPALSVTEMMEPMSDPNVVAVTCPMVVTYAPKGRILRSRVGGGTGSGSLLVRRDAARKVPMSGGGNSDVHWLAGIAKLGRIAHVKHPLYWYQAYRTNSGRGCA